MCKTLKVLPSAGGLLDQDWYHVVLIKAGLYGINEKEAKDLNERNRNIRSKSR